MSVKKIIRCDIGKKNYSQLNNKVNPKNTCNSTSMVMGLDYMGYKFPDEIFPEFEQPEDKLTMLCYTDQEVLDFYKNLSRPMFDQWIAETKKISEESPSLPLKDYIFKDSYPPNEVHAVLSFAVNKFVGKPDATYFKSDTTVEEMIKELTEKKPVVTSVAFGNPKNPINHLLLLTGVEIESNDEGKSWSPLRIFADDTYGRYDMKNKKYNLSVSGNDVDFQIDDFVACMKGIGSPRKWVHFFNYPVEVV